MEALPIMGIAPTSPVAMPLQRPLHSLEAWVRHFTALEVPVLAASAEQLRMRVADIRFAMWTPTCSLPSSRPTR